jgi:RimJ/RimL family protein N-acetyltransferase
MLETERLFIRFAEHWEVEVLRSLHNDPTVLINLTDPTPVTVDQQLKWYENLGMSSTSQRLVVYGKEQRHDDVTVEGEFIGVFRVDNLDFKNRSVMIGMDVKKDHRGKGYAKETYVRMIEYFFNQCGMNRIYLYVLETNAVAFNLYKKLGFVEEGRQREAIFRNGKYVDYVMMSLLMKDYA